MLSFHSTRRTCTSFRFAVSEQTTKTRPGQFRRYHSDGVGKPTDADTVASRMTSLDNTMALRIAKNLSPVARREFLKASQKLSHRKSTPNTNNGGHANQEASSVPLQAVTAAEIPEPTKEQLRRISLNVGLPFIGFGIMDNSILILAGDAIDVSLGVTLGISTLCAAAIGNIISDIAGVMLGTVVEDFCARLGLPLPNITEQQRTLRSVRFAGQFGCAVGVTVGCIIGMFPLLMIDSQLAERKKKAHMINQIFQDVVTEAKDLVEAENVALFLVRDTESPDNEDVHWESSGTLPKNYRGLYFWAKYVNRPHALAGGIEGGSLQPQQEDEQQTKTWSLKRNDTVTGNTGNNVVLRVPFGKGIKSRVMRTGEAFVQNERPQNDPEFDHERSLRGAETQHLLVVPIKNIKGEVIGLLQAVNKIPYDDDDEGVGFNSFDMHILNALASHVSVHLQNVEAIQSGQGEALCLKDTIRSLHRHTTVRPTH